MIPYQDVEAMDFKARSLSSSLDTGSDSPVVQSQKDEADINVIVKRFGITGVLPISVKIPLSGDYSDIVDFRGAQDLIVQARNEFMKLPADVRERFRNDPQELLYFVSDEANRDEAVKLGLIEAVPKDQPPAADPQGGQPA